MKENKKSPIKNICGKIFSCLNRYSNFFFPIIFNFSSFIALFQQPTYLASPTNPALSPTLPCLPSSIYPSQPFEGSRGLARSFCLGFRARTFDHFYFSSSFQLHRNIYLSLGESGGVSREEWRFGSRQDPALALEGKAMAMGEYFFSGEEGTKRRGKKIQIYSFFWV